MGLDTQTTAPTPLARVLVVDDEPNNIALLVRMLEPAGYKILTAANGYQALFLLSKEPVDAVVLDLMMPDIDGIQVCREIREELKMAGLPVLMLTGSTQEAHISDAFAAGATDYLTKPVRKQELLARLSSHIGASRAVVQMRALQEQLEDQVTQRTQQLRQAVAQLEEEIADRRRAQQSLQTHNALLTTLLQTALMGIIVIDERGTIHTFNRAAERMFGYEAADVLGKNVSLLMPDPDRSRHDGYLQNYLRGGAPKIIGIGRETYGLRRDGTTFAVDLAVSEVRVGETRLFNGILSDISARKAMQDALMQSQERLLRQNAVLRRLAAASTGTLEAKTEAIRETANLCRQALNATEVSIWLATSDETPQLVPVAVAGGPAEPCTATTQAAVRYWQALGGLGGGGSATTAHREATQEVSTTDGQMTLLKTAIAGGQTHGVVICTRDSAQNWELDEHNFVAFLAVQVALAVEKELKQRAEKRVLESAARLQNAQRIARLGDWEYDIQQRSFAASQGLARLLLGDSRRTLDSVDDMYSHLEPADGPRLAAQMEHCVAQGLPVSLDVHAVVNQERLCLQARIVPIIDDQGRVIRVSGTLLDLTAQKRAEHALKEMRDHLQDRVDEQTRDLIEARDDALAGERTMSAFLANMSHEIRTPLHAILSYARFGIKESERLTASTTLGHFREIHDSGEELLELLNNLLDLSKLKAGKMIYEFEPVSLGHLAQETLDQFRALIKEKNVMAFVKSEGRERPLAADRRRLAQVLRNLVSNAIKFSPALSTIEVRIDFRDPDITKFSVTDEGVGIPEGELDAIFSPFTQSSKTKSNAGGTGLGLAICREIVDVGHHGRIYASNGTPRGATFTVELPNHQRD